MKIEFIKDYTLTVDNPSCTDGMIGCQPSRTINFKLGQVVSQGINGGLDSKNFYIGYGNYTNAIPLEYVKVLNDDGTPYNKKTSEEVQFKTPTQSKPISDFEYYTSSAFLKRASVSIVPVALIGAYSYHKKFSLTKTALLVSIPIVGITILQYIGMGGGKNAYWGIFAPPSIRENKNAKLRELEKRTGIPQKLV